MSEKKSKFWDYAGAMLHILPDFAKPKLHNMLHEQFEKTIIESAVKLFVCVIAVCVAVYKPFGGQCSLWMSSLLFIGMFLWSIVESVSYCMLPIKIIQERSMRMGIIKFIKWKFPKVAVGSRVYEKVCGFGVHHSPIFRNLRSSNTIIWEFVCFLAKDIVTFASLFSLYIILVHWIFKPIILEKFAGLTTMQIYLFPIRLFL